MLAGIFKRAACVVAAVAGFALPASAASYNKVIAFGDSLSDNGNFFALTGGAQPQPGDYFIGRFSNGKVAVELLADGLGVTLKDYAVGGATTTLLNGAVTAADGFPPSLTNTGLLSQITQYKTDSGSVADPNALYFIWAGSNDIRYSAPADIPATIATAIGNLAGSVQQLYGIGARHFVLPLLPDLGLTPQGMENGPGFASVLTQISDGFNLNLTATYNQLLALPNLTFIPFDTSNFQRAVKNNPSTYGLSNVTNACFSGYVGEPGTQCLNPADFLYWDKVHPTTVAHQLIANQILAAAVPEPEMAFMMLSGLLVLAAARRRLRAA